MQKDYIVVPADGPYPEARLSLNQAAAIANLVNDLPVFAAMLKRQGGAA